jgi:hypothetical protein
LAFIVSLLFEGVGHAPWCWSTSTSGLSPKSNYRLYWFDQLYQITQELARKSADFPLCYEIDVKVTPGPDFYG